MPQDDLVSHQEFFGKDRASLGLSKFKDLCPSSNNFSISDMIKNLKQHHGQIHFQMF